MLANLKANYLDQYPQASTTPNHYLADVTKDNLKTLTYISNVVYTPDHPEGESHPLLAQTNTGVAQYSLEKIQYASNVTKLDLSMELNLNPPFKVDGHDLYIHSDIVDVTPIQGLTKLEKLTIHGGRIKDITPLLEILNGPNIQSANLVYNCIADLSGITNPKLTGINGNFGFRFIETDPVYVDPANPTVTVDYKSLMKLAHGEDLDTVYPYEQQTTWLAIKELLDKTKNLLSPDSVISLWSYFNAGTDYTRDKAKGTFTLKNVTHPQQSPAPPAWGNGRPFPPSAPTT
ncbi:hypothetical protein [Bifidobacterium aemilianum]|uniref:hypothetical protein n=1 Tax=Bifidobacterium aemilianum TaxID=2493120 RepID=UPI0013751D28|nr:hypothetical protein [Bifidobacterium aemilianum]